MTTAGRSERTSSDLRLLNGTVAKTIFGWVAHSLGMAIDEINDQWFWGRDYEYNRSSGRIPDAPLLNAARLAAALQLALAAAAFFHVLRLSLNRPTAYIASALFTLHPNMLINGRRAMMEGSHILGLTLVLLAGVWLIRERKWWTYALLGVCSGFAIATKHPNAIICALVFLAVSAEPAWHLLRQRGPSQRAHFRSLAGIAAAGLAACLTFLLLNPAWWSAPLRMPALVLSLRSDLLRAQVGPGSADTSQYRRAWPYSAFFRYRFRRLSTSILRWDSWAGIRCRLPPKLKPTKALGMAGILDRRHRTCSASSMPGAGRIFGALNLARDSSNVSSDMQAPCF